MELTVERLNVCLTAQLVDPSDVGVQCTPLSLQWQWLFSELWRIPKSLRIEDAGNSSALYF